MLNAFKTNASVPKGVVVSITVYTYLLYLVISVALTVWVARTLFKNGRIFLVDVFRGNAELADSVNHLLVVGFYLINLGIMVMSLHIGRDMASVQESIETLAEKLGLVLLVLGLMHFANLGVFSQMRRQSRSESSLLPAEPDAGPAPEAR